jgi:hypothetical protein
MKTCRFRMNPPPETHQACHNQLACDAAWLLLLMRKIRAVLKVASHQQGHCAPQHDRPLAWLLQSHSPADASPSIAHLNQSKSTRNTLPMKDTTDATITGHQKCKNLPIVRDMMGNNTQYTIRTERGAAVTRCQALGHFGQHAASNRHRAARFPKLGGYTVPRKSSPTKPRSL